MAITDWFSGLATIGGFAYFLAGFATAVVMHCVRQKLHHQKMTIPWQRAGIALGIATILIVSFQSSVAYSTAEKTAREVQDCQREFNQALRDRSRITQENDDLSENQRIILFTWINGLIYPPQPYESMPTDDSRRQAYVLALTIETERKLKESLARQDVLQAERSIHPLPDPLCGKG